MKEDEERRVKEIHVTFTLVLPDYDNAQFIPRFSDEGYNKFEEKGLMDQEIGFNFDTFYNVDGTENCTLYQFSRENQPIHINFQGNRTTKPLKSKNRLNCEQKGEPSCSPIRLTI